MLCLQVRKRKGEEEGVVGREEGPGAKSSALIIVFNLSLKPVG